MKAYMLAYINKDGTVCPLAYIGLHFAYIRFRPVLENRLLATVAVYYPAAMNKTHEYSLRTIRGLETQGRCYICLCPLNVAGHHYFFFSTPLSYLRRRYVAVLYLQTGHLP